MDHQQLDINRRRFIAGFFALGLGSTLMPGALAALAQDAETITLDPMTESARLLDWIAPLWGADLPAPRNVVHVPGQAMTDWPDPFISILGTGSLDALSEQAGAPLSPHRFRGNLWVEGWAPFEEFDLIGRTLRIGAAELEIRARITRCKATCANPETGLRDVDTLALLNGTYGHQDFGVYALVTRPGEIAAGDTVEIA